MCSLRLAQVWLSEADLGLVMRFVNRPEAGLVWLHATQSRSSLAGLRDATRMAVYASGFSICASCSLKWQVFRAGLMIPHGGACCIFSRTLLWVGWGDGVPVWVGVQVHRSSGTGVFICAIQLSIESSHWRGAGWILNLTRFECLELGGIGVHCLGGRLPCPGVKG